MTTIGRGRGRGRGALIAKFQDEQKPGQNVKTEVVSGISSNNNQQQQSVTKIATTPKKEQQPVTHTSTTPKKEQQSVSHTSTTPKKEQQSAVAHTSTTPKKETAAQSFKAVIDENKKLNEANPNAKSISEILKGLERMTCSEVLSKIPPEMSLHNSEKPFEELCEKVCEQALKDPDFAPTAAKLCNQIWVNETTHQFIRSPLLTIVQRKYTKREEFKKRNRNHLYGLCVFLCELYKVLRLRQQPLKPLTAFVVQILKDLLECEKLSTDDVLYFYQELESVGSVIENSDKEKMDDLINQTRLIVISSDITASVRCRLIQVLELRAASWQMSDDVKINYEDLQQELISEGR